MPNVHRISLDPGSWFSFPFALLRDENHVREVKKPFFIMFFHAFVLTAENRASHFDLMSPYRTGFRDEEKVERAASGARPLRIVRKPAMNIVHSNP